MNLIKRARQILLLNILTWLSLQPVSAQHIQKDSITIQGSVAAKRDLPEGSYFKCKLVQNNALDTWAGYTDIYRAAILNRHFEITIPANDETFYVTFQIEYPDGKLEFLNMGGSWETPLLLQRGDRLSMRIGIGNYLDFSGKGAVKLNCQKNIYELGFLPNGAIDRDTELVNSSKFQQETKALDQISGLALQLKLAILYSYRDELQPRIFDQLYKDCIGRHFYAFYWKLLMSFQLDSGKAIPSAKKILQKMEAATTPANTSSAAVSSIHYANYLMLMERVNQQYLNPVDSSYAAFDFKALQTVIKNKYNGALRDKIRLLSFMEMADKPKVMEEIDETIAQMENNVSRTMLRQWRDKGSFGKSAYPLRLPDEQGKIHNLKDFKGKVIIADFWFNGCRPCTQMATALRPFAEVFKDNKNVVFLSINVDRNKIRWLSGLEEGIYTFPGAIHLSTFGENKEEHPLLKYYNFNGFPQLLIIDQQGKMVSTSPPDPRLDQGEKLKQLISSLL